MIQDSIIGSYAREVRQKGTIKIESSNKQWNYKIETSSEMIVVREAWGLQCSSSGLEKYKLKELKYVNNKIYLIFLK